MCKSRGLRPLPMIFSYTGDTSYIHSREFTYRLDIIVENDRRDRTGRIRSVSAKPRYPFVILIPTISDALDTKNRKILGGREASRGESAFTFLSDVVSLLSRATCLFTPLSLSPWQLLLSIVRYQLLGESYNSDLPLMATFLLFLVDLSISLLSTSRALSHLLSPSCIDPPSVLRHVSLSHIVGSESIYVYVTWFSSTIQTYIVRSTAYFWSERMPLQIEWLFIAFDLTQTISKLYWTYIS